MSSVSSQESAPAQATDVLPSDSTELTVEALQEIYANEIAQDRAIQREQWDVAMFVAFLLGCLGLFSLCTAYFLLPAGSVRRSILSPRPPGVTFTTVYYVSTWLGIFGFIVAKFSRYNKRILTLIINGLILLPSIVLLVIAFAVATLFELG